MLHLIDELSSSGGDLIPRKRRSVDICDETIRVVDSLRDDHEPTISILERDADPPSEVPLSKGVVEGMPLLKAGV